MITRIATYRPSKNTTALVLDMDGQRIQADYSRLSLLDTDTKLQTFISAEPKLVNLKESLHIHRNRDGSIAAAFGKAPTRWPEDEDRESVIRN